MKWEFNHSDLFVNSNTNKVHSSCQVKLLIGDTEVPLYNSEVPEEHVVGTRKALVDSGNMLRAIGLEMLRKAEKIN